MAVWLYNVTVQRCDVAVQRYDVAVRQYDAAVRWAYEPLWLAVSQPWCGPGGGGNTMRGSTVCVVTAVPNNQMTTNASTMVSSPSHVGSHVI